MRSYYRLLAAIAFTIQSLQAHSKQHLQSLLEQYELSQDSQILVFSKTSLQKDYISPETPRAIYFNEDHYLGWMPKGDAELISIDSNNTFQYFILKAPDITRASWSKLEAADHCISCHLDRKLVLQSVHTQASGNPIGTQPIFTPDYRSPLAQRWGGWFVTGEHGHDLHMGNVFDGVITPAKQQAAANLKELPTIVQRHHYLTASSDIVALMVFEHQYVMHNALLDVHQIATQVLQNQRYTKSQQQQILKRRAQKLCDLILFKDEYPLEFPIVGDLQFQKAFLQNRKISVAGKSLKDFNLKTRVFQYRCSYMVHSASFSRLPQPFRRIVWQELYHILSHPHLSEQHYNIPAQEAAEILEILHSTEAETHNIIPSSK